MLYNAFIEQKTQFQRSINLEFDLGKLQVIEQYIPTAASVEVLKVYLHNALHPAAQRASVFIGPYGKGKTHTLLVYLSIVSMYNGTKTDAALSMLTENIRKIDTEAADMIAEIRNKRIRLLPVLINESYADLRQSLLVALNKALLWAGLDDIMPDTYFDAVIHTLDTWRDEYPATYGQFLLMLKADKTNEDEFCTEIKHYDREAYQRFTRYYSLLTSGSTFSPAVHSDISRLIAEINKAITKDNEYGGIAIVFDEFSKYLETSFQNNVLPEMKIIQDLAEFASRSDTPQLHLICVTHKAIAEYGPYVPKIALNAFKAVEGRFATVYFTQQIDSSLPLIRNIFKRDQKHFKMFYRAHNDEFQKTISDCASIGLFAENKHLISELADACFPMHPLALYVLIRLSEKVGQNERSLFGFLSDADSALGKKLRSCREETYSLVGVDTVYRYFVEIIKSDLYNPKMRELAIHADALTRRMSAENTSVVYAITALTMLDDSELLPSERNVRIALSMDSNDYENSVKALARDHVIYIRKSDGAMTLTTQQSRSIRRLIEEKTEALHGRVNECELLSEVVPVRYVLPRRYNNEHEMVRFFREMYMTIEDFMLRQSFSDLFEASFADGFILRIVAHEPVNIEEARKHLCKIDDARILACISRAVFEETETVNEYQAIGVLLQKSVKDKDTVAADELSFYREDIRAVLCDSISGMFDPRSTTILCVNELADETHTIGGIVSNVCDMLYPKAPVICNEMINKEILSGTIRSSRRKVLDYLIQTGRGIQLDHFAVHSAEATLYRALIERQKLSDRHSDSAMQDMLREIDVFIESSYEEAQVFESIYSVLRKSPYGVRKGIIAVYIVAALGSRISDSTILFQGKELPMTGDTFDSIDEHPDQCRLKMHSSTHQSRAYIERLQLLFGGGRLEYEKIEFTKLLGSINQVIRNLPKYSREYAEELLPDGMFIPISSNLLKIRTELLKFNNNPYQLLMEIVPELLGIPVGEACADTLQAAITGFESHLNRLGRAVSSNLIHLFNGNANEALWEAMQNWWVQLPDAHKEQVYDANTNALVNYVTSLTPADDEAVIRSLSVTMMLIPLADWNDQTLKRFLALMNECVDTLSENVPEAKTEEVGAQVQITIQSGNQETRRIVKSSALTPLGETMQNNISSIMEEYADSVEPEELMLILTKLLLETQKGGR